MLLKPTMYIFFFVIFSAATARQSRLDLFKKYHGVPVTHSGFVPKPALNKLAIKIVPNFCNAKTCRKCAKFLAQRPAECRSTVHLLCSATWRVQNCCASVLSFLQY